MRNALITLALVIALTLIARGQDEPKIKGPSPAYQAQLKAEADKRKIAADAKKARYQAALAKQKAAQKRAAASAIPAGVSRADRQTIMQQTGQKPVDAKAVERARIVDRINRP